ncbi:MAG: hypothetical protein II244_05995 [Clostridia bacterium]|nr:hypothetical protein [Clostridia bacterium]
MELVANFTLNNESLDAQFDVSEVTNFDALFQIDVIPDISGLATKEELHETSETINNRIDGVVEAFDEDIEIINDNIEEISTELDTKVTDVQGSGVIQASRENNVVTLKSVNFVFEQGIASDTWIIVHNLGKKPSVILTDSAGTEFKAHVEYNTLDQLTVYINGATTGKAYLN